MVKWLAMETFQHSISLKNYKKISIMKYRREINI